MIAHGGGGTSKANADVARKFPNVYLETCGSGAPFGGIKYYVDAGLEDKLLFGTDMAIMDARHQIAKVVTLDISDQAKRKILGLNAMGLLGIEI